MREVIYAHRAATGLGGPHLNVVEVAGITAQGRVISRLHEMDIPTFQPTYIREIRHARRIERRVMPLFSCYLFASVHGKVSVVCRVREVLGVLRKAGSIEPHKVPEEALAALRCSAIIQHQAISDGDEVMVKYGRWKDLCGIARFDDQQRMALLVSMLGRECAIPMSVGQVEKLPPHKMRDGA